MRKTFTFLILLFALIFSLPAISSAYNFSFGTSSYDARFGDKELIKVYPNPLVTDATIKISSDFELDKSKVSIVFYNIIGGEVYKITPIKEYELKIGREIFKNSGIYFYQLKIDESIMSTGRITVK